MRLIATASALLLSAWLFTLRGEILMEEDFSQPITTNWTPYGEPPPLISDSTGLPPPSFDNNGDTLYNSGAISRKTFDYSKGLVLECDMYVTSNERGAWITGTIGFSRITETLGEDGSTAPDIAISYFYMGEADWQRPHMQGGLSARVSYPDGSRDEISLFRVNQYLDSWHRFRVMIDEDLRVSFFVDTTLIHRTETPLPPDMGDLVVVLGDRSGRFGRVFHDNVLVRTQ